MGWEEGESVGGPCCCLMLRAGDVLGGMSLGRGRKAQNQESLGGYTLIQNMEVGRTRQDEGEGEGL